MEQAIKIAPFLDASYVNLASLLRVTENDLKSLELINKGLSNIPDSGPLYYVKAMTLIRLNRIDEALNELKRAYQIDAYNSSYLYAYALLLDQTGESQKALTIVGKRIQDFGRDVQLLKLGLYLAQKNRIPKIFACLSAC